MLVRISVCKYAALGSRLCLSTAFFLLLFFLDIDIALMLNYNVFFLLFFLDIDLRRAFLVAHHVCYRVGYLALCWFAFQGVSMPR